MSRFADWTPPGPNPQDVANERAWALIDEQWDAINRLSRRLEILEGGVQRVVADFHALPRVDRRDATAIDLVRNLEKLL